MNKAILRYELDPNNYEIHCEDDPHQAEIDGLTIYEKFSLNERLKFISPYLGNYQIIIQTEVNNSRELQSKYFDIKAIAQELDRSWIYVCGHPLIKRVHGFLGPYLDFPDGKIDGWTNNYREAEKEVSGSNGHIVAFHESIFHASFQYWPLDKALGVLKAYRGSHDNIKALVDLHFFSHKVGDSYSMLLFLSKAMELVRAMLPGKTDEEREKKLPIEFRSKIKTSLHDVIGLANNRFENRHIVKDKFNCTLHQKLDNSEINAYKYDTDLFIRYVVCQNLSIPLITPFSLPT